MFGDLKQFQLIPIKIKTYFKEVFKIKRIK